MMTSPSRDVCCNVDPATRRWQVYFHPYLTMDGGKRWHWFAICKTCRVRIGNPWASFHGFTEEEIDQAKDATEKENEPCLF